MANIPFGADFEIRNLICTTGFPGERQKYGPELPYFPAPCMVGACQAATGWEAGEPQSSPCPHFKHCLMKPGTSEFGFSTGTSPPSKQSCLGVWPRSWIRRCPFQNSNNISIPAPGGFLLARLPCEIGGVPGRGARRFARAPGTGCVAWRSMARPAVSRLAN